MFSRHLLIEKVSVHNFISFHFNYQMIANYNNIESDKLLLAAKMQNNQENLLETYKISSLISSNDQISLFESMANIYVSLRNLKTKLENNNIDFNNLNFIINEVKKDEDSIKKLSQLLETGYDETIDIIFKCFSENISKIDSQNSFSCVQLIGNCISKAWSFFWLSFPNHKHKTREYNQRINAYANLLNSLYRTMIFYPNKIVNNNELIIFYEKINDSSFHFLDFYDKNEFIIKYHFLCNNSEPKICDNDKYKQFLNCIDKIQNSMKQTE